MGSHEEVGGVKDDSQVPGRSLGMGGGAINEGGRTKGEADLEKRS